ncbi:MAG: hypothetical protein NVV74_05850 [Magnetospirillum sp.]|nr:hypothetical protein [Magnetospirillum sp.]
MRRDSVREPTGSPVCTYSSTMCRKISRERSFSSVITGLRPRSIALVSNRFRRDGI